MCVLKYAENGPCASPSFGFGNGLQVYAHPRCHCRPDGRAEEASQIPHRTVPSQPWNAKAPRAARVAMHGGAEKYSLPGRDHAVLGHALRHVAGIYCNGSAPVALTKSRDNLAGSEAASAAMWQAVLLTSINAAYVELYLNWACHASRYRLRHLVWAQDRIAAAMLLRSPWIDEQRTMANFNQVSRLHCATLFYSAHMANALATVPWSNSFQTRAFNRISIFKIVAVRLILHAGYDAWFCDVDVVFHADPWPHFARSVAQHRAHILRGSTQHGSALVCDYEYAANERCEDQNDPRDANAEGNTGFHLLVSSPQMLHFLRLVLQRADRLPNLDDQTLLWQVLQEKHKNGSAIYVPLRARPFEASSSDLRLHMKAYQQPRAGHAQQVDIVYCQLPRQTHASGQCLDVTADALHRNKLVTIHANWLSGPTRKASRLSQYGHWILGSTPRAAWHACSPWAPAARDSRVRNLFMWAWAAIAFHPELLVGAVSA